MPSERIGKIDLELSLDFAGEDYLDCNYYL